MADIELAIKIPEEEYKYIQITKRIKNPKQVSNAIFDGTPLPKWTPGNVPPKASGRYLVVHGGTNLMDIDNYTTEEDAKEIFDEAYETFTGWDSKNVVKWMPLPKP